MPNERDIVDRLRTTSYVSIPLLEEASAEITRLRSELEAEREACKLLAKELCLWRGGVIRMSSFNMVYGPGILQMMAETNANPLAAKAVEGARG